MQMKFHTKNFRTKNFRMISKGISDEYNLLYKLKMSLILKIYKTLLGKLNVFKRVLIRNLYFCNGSRPFISEDNYGKELKKRTTICMNKKKTFLMMRRTIQLLFRIKTVKIILLYFLVLLKNFGR